jgi:hypothetical protein
VRSLARRFPDGVPLSALAALPPRLVPALLRDTNVQYLERRKLGVGSL